MKKALVILAALGLLVSPLMVSQADAAPVKAKHHAIAKHNNKKHKKNHVAKHFVRKHNRKATV